MGRSLTLALKDIKLLLRDKSAMFWVLVFPLMIAVLFGSIFGGSNTSSKIKVALVDRDGSKESRALIGRLQGSKALDVEKPEAGIAPEDQVRKGNLTAFILIPKGYGDAASKFQYASGPALEIGIDPTRNAEGGMLQGVLSEAAYKGMSDSMAQPADMRQSVQQGLSKLTSAASDDPNSKETKRFLTELDRYLASGASTTPGGPGRFSFEGPKIESVPVQATGVHPANSFEITFPQAIIWGLLGVMSTFAVSLVKERRQGTLIRLRVSPMSFAQILAGKGLACFLSCAGVMAILLAVGKLVFNVRLQSPLLLLLAIFSGAFCLVGVMMLLSVMGKTEQAVSGASWGVMITMSMFGGGMIPLFMMPPWMQTASNFSPLKWTVLSIEGAIFRGFTFWEMMTPCAVLIAIGIVSFAAGVKLMAITSSSAT